MKKFLLSFLGVVVVLTAAYAATVQINQTAKGLQIGSKASGADAIGFWGATPSTQSFVTVGSVSDAGRLTNLISQLVSVGLIKTN